MKLAGRSEFDCPFCGALVYAGELVADIDTPPEAVGSMAVVHYEPTCAAYDANEAHDFISAAYGRRLAQTGGGAS